MILRCYTLNDHGNLTQSIMELSCKNHGILFLIFFGNPDTIFKGCDFNIFKYFDTSFYLLFLCVCVCLESFKTSVMVPEIVIYIFFHLFRPSLTPSLIFISLLKYPGSIPETECMKDGK